MIYFDSDMSKSTNTVVYFHWKAVIYIYPCGKCRTFFRLVNKRASYPFGIISLAHAPVNVTDFSIGSIHCNPNNPVIILRSRWSLLRNKSWKPECVGSLNMDWRILVFYPEPEARDKIY
jgi:hypothetical protein